ncbi:MAG: DUF4062 domain-containing protein [Myxococcales bacterium]|nr:MAG: DUF4062 domain-containing protein [Myxococcales bacterium]
MKVYLSSTYRDLREHRLAVDRALRRMGHDVIGMEQYVAEGAKPLERCLADVRTADAYLLMLAWRYGSPADAQQRSITELEFLEAKSAGKPVLAFLLDPEAPWPPAHVDAMAANSAAAASISRFRGEVGSNYLAGIFVTPEDLASQVSAAVARQSLGQSMVERVLAQDSVNATDMVSFGSGQEINPSSMSEIANMVSRAGNSRAMVIDLGEGDDWWSTRLYLLATLLRDLTNIRQILFRSRQKFGGMASPAAVLDGMGDAFPELGDFRRKLANAAPFGAPSRDTGRELQRQTDIWKDLFGGANPELREDMIKVGVRSELLQKWLGERLVDRCIRVDESGPTMVQVQQIVDSLLPDLPLERQVTSTAGTHLELQVICRDSFALELAREWVRSSLPRVPAR